MEPRAPSFLLHPWRASAAAAATQGCAGGWDWEVLRCTMAANEDFEMLGDARSADGLLFGVSSRFRIHSGNSHAAEVDGREGFEMPRISLDCLASNLKDST